MAARSNYCYEDSVCISHGGNVYFGIVTENDEYISSDDEEFGNDKSCEFRPLQKGEVRVSWHPSGREVVMSQKMLKLADRSLMPGDVVRRIDNKRAVQCGYCNMTRVAADVEILGNKLVICSVPSSDLISIEEFQEDHAVVLDSWTGVIVKVESDVIVKASDGSKFIMPFDDAVEMVEIIHCGQGTSNQFNNFIYPKQNLYGPAVMFRSAKWIHKASNISTLWKTNPEKHVHLTVEKIRTKSVSVNWQSMGFSPSNENVKNKVPPPYKIEGALLKKLRILKSLESCSLQIGDKKFFKIPENSVMIPKDEWKQNRGQDACDIPVCENKSFFFTSREIKKTEKVGNVCDDSVDIVQNSTEKSDPQKSETESDRKDDDELSSEYEDVDDSDEPKSDTESTSSQSTNAFKKSKKLHNSKNVKLKKTPSVITNLLKKKKLKRAQKKEKHLEVPEPVPSAGDMTVVEVLNTQTVVDVMWQDGSVEKDIPACELYPMNHVEDHEFFPGDFVVESKDGGFAVDLHYNQYAIVQSVNYNARIAHVKWMQTQVSSAADLVPQVVGAEEVSVYDLIGHPDFGFRAQTVVSRIADLQSEPKIIGEELSPAGQVIGINLSGMIEIEWSDGKRSFCYPQELEVLGEYDSDDNLFGDSDDESSVDDSNSSWETQSVQSSSVCSFVDEPKTSYSILIKWMQSVTNLSNVLENVAKTQLLNVTKGNIKKLLEIFKKAREIDSKLGLTLFDTLELKNLAKQLQERKFSNQSKLDKFTELFDIPSNSVSDFCEDLAKLKTSWEEAEENSKSNSIVTSSDSEPSKKADTSPEPSASIVIKPKPNSQEDPVLVFIYKLQLALIALSKHLLSFSEHLKPSANNQSATNQLDSSEIEEGISRPHVDDNLIASTIKQCQELNCSNFALSSQHSLFGSAAEFVSSSEDAAEIKISMQVVTTNENNSPQSSECNHNSECKSEDKSELSVMENAQSMGSDAVCEGFSSFVLMDNAPDSHHFKNVQTPPTNSTSQFKAIKKEWKLLKNGVPDGIIVKAFGDRMDLLSIMIKGPTRTPYEDGLFFFDLKLPGNYPSVPPVCHYISFCKERLNPNLYEEGKVCLSLLGTWGGKGTEVWTSNSTLLQLIISIQGLILVPEPYYNEPGHEAQRNTNQGKENSRMYNEMAVLKLTQSMTKLLTNLPHSFIDEIEIHYKSNILRLINRYEKWLNMSESWNTDHPQTPTSPTVYREAHVDYVTSTDDFYLPEFPLLPASKGFCLSVRKALFNLKESMKSKWPYLEL